jgi:hypothetical protein
LVYAFKNITKSINHLVDILNYSQYFIQVGWIMPSFLYNRHPFIISGHEWAISIIMFAGSLINFRKDVAMLSKTEGMQTPQNGTSEK